jgi:hypothetical protein
MNGLPEGGGGRKPSCVFGTFPGTFPTEESLPVAENRLLRLFFFDFTKATTASILTINPRPNSGASVSSPKKRFRRNAE